MLLDIMMPVKSGYEVCVEVRKHDATLPILFLTAKSAEEDVVLGLGLGADDFIAKPLRIRELLARITTALRRTRGDAAPAPASQHATFAIGKSTIDTRRFLVTAEDGVAQPLTIRELGLLKAFAEHPGEVLSRDWLLDEVWGLDYAGGTRTLDQHIVQVRRKLGEAGDLIETVRGAGYRLRNG
jgi:DNA-binding response OmpR family regulator